MLGVSVVSSTRSPSKSSVLATSPGSSASFVGELGGECCCLCLCWCRYAEAVLFAVFWEGSKRPQG